MKILRYFRKFWMLYLSAAIIFLAATNGTDRVITTIAENVPIRRNFVIIIDAGHGGLDGGAISCTGILESNINLSIALKLNDLCHLLGLETVMVRTEDRSTYTEGTTISAKKASDLRNRVKLVNETENGILVSIHQNTFSDRQYNGAQVFYGNVGDSQDLAECIQRTFSETINPGSKRQAKPAGKVYLLQHIKRTGVLIECGFISNPEEEAKLRSDAYQGKLCCVIVSALQAHLST